MPGNGVQFTWIGWRRKETDDYPYFAYISGPTVSVLIAWPFSLEFWH
jgi:hypothetical protein